MKKRIKRGDTRAEMQLEISEEYLQFLHDIQDKGFLNGCYMDETEYEDEYSHNTIGEAMEILREKIRTYLHENRPGEFVVYSDWSIQVMKKEKAEEMEMRKILIDSSVVR